MSEVEAGPCGPGYSRVLGDIDGWGQIRGKFEDSLSGCADQCGQEEICCSFEHSSSTGLCNLNWDYRTYNIPYKDYVFCRRNIQSKMGFKHIIKGFKSIPLRDIKH